MSDKLQEDTRSTGQNVGVPAAGSGAHGAEAPSTQRTNTNPQHFEDLMLDELVAQMLRAPVRTWRRLQTAANLAARCQPHAVLVPAAAAPRSADAQRLQAIQPKRLSLKRLLCLKHLRTTMYALAIVCGFIGSVLARGDASTSGPDDYALQIGAPYLWLGFLLWFAGDFAENLPQIQTNWRSISRTKRALWAARIPPRVVMLIALFQFVQSMGAPRDHIAGLAGAAMKTFLAGLLLQFVVKLAGQFTQRAAETPARTNQSSSSVTLRQRIAQRGLLQTVAPNELGRWRLVILVAAPLSSAYLWANTHGNRIESSTIGIWLLSIALWAFCFAPNRWNIFDWATDRVDSLRRIKWRQNRLPMLALALIIALGFQLRFTDLDSSPPQMISDHAENVKDAFNIRYDNYKPILFTNYSAREPLHYYLLVALSWLPGHEVDRYAFSLLSAIEGLLTLPLIFWLAQELMGKRDRRFGQTFGLIAAALVAVSWWHITMSRQGFRITLCPLLMAWSLVFYTRALRYNNRTDFVKAGLLLGFGLMSYQPMQMLAVIYIVGIAITLLANRHDWRARLGYAVNSVVLVFTAFVVFLPLFHVWVEYPELALMRQTQSIFGNAPLSTEERLGFLSQNGFPALLSNFRQTALMFHHTSDIIWISNAHDEPAADPLTATLILLGAAAWLTLMRNRRDPAIWLVPAALILMLIVPSLALANTNYSPHYMRALGSLCPIFLIAAFPLALLCKAIRQAFPRPFGLIVAVSVAAGAILYIYDYSSRLYFGRYTENYLARAQPHRQAGAVLRGFAKSDGAYGNAFALHYPHWWDNRAVGMEAGSPKWFNVIDELEQLPEYLRKASERQDDLRLDPNRDLLFFYNQASQDSPRLLREWFPQGRALKHDMRYDSQSFFSYRVPALGWEGLRKFLGDHA